MIAIQFPAVFRKPTIVEDAVPQLPDLRTVGAMPLTGGCQRRQQVVVMDGGVARYGIVLAVRVDFWTKVREWVSVGFIDADGAPAIQLFRPREVVLLAAPVQQ